MNNEYFSLKLNDNNKIRGMYHEAKDWNGKTIIMLNGYKSAFSDGGRQQRVHSIHLCENGFNVIRFDYIGYGESDGEFKNANITSMVNNTKEIIKWTLEKYGFDKEIILSGGSMGGLVTMATANLNEFEQVKRIILHCPALDFYDVYMNQGFKEGLSTPMTDVDDDAYIDTWENDLFKYKDILHNKTFNGDVLIFHGDKDPVIPYEPIREFAELNNIKLITINDGDHGFKQSIKGPEGIKKNFEIQDMMWREMNEFIDG